MTRMMEACNRHGKFGVMVGFDEAVFTRCMALGYHMLVAGGDVPFLASSSRQACDQARGWIAGKTSGSSQAPKTTGPY